MKIEGAVCCKGSSKGCVPNSRAQRHQGAECGREQHGIELERSDHFKERSGKHPPKNNHRRTKVAPGFSFSLFAVLAAFGGVTCGCRKNSRGGEVPRGPGSGGRGGGEEWEA